MQAQTDLVRIVTTLGTRFYPVGTRAYTSLGGKGLYFHEQVSDLSPNAMILWHNKHIDAAFEDVLPYLHQSPRYRRAEETVMATNSQGQKTPQFRIRLIRAMAAEEVVGAESREDLEQKIMREGGKEFTQREYAAMRDFLHTELQQLTKHDAELSRSPYAIADWLSGETVCVSNPKLLDLLAKVTGSPVLGEWYAGVGKTGSESAGFWREYKFYTVLRQGVIRYLVGRSKGELKTKAVEGNANAAGGSQDEQKKGGFDMTPEIQLALNQFMEQINEEFSLARVLKVERLKQKGNGAGHHEKPVPNLTDGAYVGQPTADMETVSLTENTSIYNCIDQTVTFALYDFFEGALSGRYKTGKGAEAAAKIILKDEYFLSFRLIEHLFLNVIKELGFIDTEIAEEPEIARGIGFGFSLDNSGKEVFGEFRDVVVRDLATDITSGGIDEVLRIPPLTIYNACKHMGNIERSRPAVLDEYRSLGMEVENKIAIARLGRRQRREMELRLEKLERTLRLRYGYQAAAGLSEPTQFLIPNFLYNSWTYNIDLILQEVHVGSRPLTTAGQAQIFKRVNEVMKAMAEKSGRILDPEFVRTTPEIVTAHDFYKSMMFTSHKALAILQNHGLEALYRFILQANFALEENPAKPPETLEAAVAARSSQDELAASNSFPDAGKEEAKRPFLQRMLGFFARKKTDNAGG